MKYCQHCGNQIMDEAVICVKCGCAVASTATFSPQQLLNQLSDKLKINGILWLIFGILQILIGIYLSWITLIIGILNIISAISDLKYSSTILKAPSNIVERFRPLVGPIITLVYNALFGGIIGIAGSIYYLIEIRNFVLKNESVFSVYNTQATQN